MCENVCVNFVWIQMQSNIQRRPYTTIINRNCFIFYFLKFFFMVIDRTIFAKRLYAETLQRSCFRLTNRSIRCLNNTIRNIHTRVLYIHLTEHNTHVFLFERSSPHDE